MKNKIKFKKDFKAVGQFFYGENFNEPAFITSRGIDGFNILAESLENVHLTNKIKSVRWITNFTPKNSGLYSFENFNRDFIHIFINGKIVEENGVTLKKGEIYKLVIAYFGNPSVTQDELINLNIILLFNKNKKPLDCDEFSIPKSISFDELFSIIDEDILTENLIDTDDDGIYDEWEKTGYTVIGGVVKKWDDSYKANGYKKFVSNPYESHTAGDPYSDLEKASGAIDKSINKVAWDPLVAAYPSISVGMENLIISNTAVESSENRKSVSRSTSSSIGMSNTIGIDANAGFSLFSGFSASITGHYSNTSSQIVDSSKTAGQEWANHLSIDASKSANINANIRYYNTGTAPIYNLRPTTNLILGRETISTISSQLNQEAFSLAPGSIYPNKNIHGISLNTLDQFSTTPITINFDQLDRLELGESLKLETTQFKGSFATRNPSGGQVVLENNEWAHYIPQIESVTAGIIVNFNNKFVIERRVAAKDINNPNDLTPELTLEEALEKSMGAKKDSNNKLYIENEYTDLSYTLDQDLVHFVFDRKTKKLIDKELINKTNIYDIIIRPGMNIQINIPSIYDKFSENKLQWSGGQYISIDNERCYKFNNKISLSSLNLNGSSRYLIAMDVKADTDCRLMLDFNEPDGSTSIIDIKTSYSRKHVLFQIEEVDDLLDIINIRPDKTTNVYIDNFSIIKLDKGTDYLKIENLDYINTIKNKKSIFITSSDITKCISNENNNAVVKNYINDSNFKFYLDFISTSGGYVIYNPYSSGSGKALTWDYINQDLIFSKFEGKNSQIWFFNKTEINGKIYYRIINSLDRSKVLEFIPSSHGIKNLQINNIDEKNTNQLFLWKLE